MSRPLCIDLYAGLGGWAEGFLAEGWNVIGFDIERHDYGTGGYPGQLVIQDVLTLHGSQFTDADVIVASPPCQEYSYMVMPWTRAKAKAAWYREDPTRQVALTALFDACFRIQREAIAATGSRTCPECDGYASTPGCCRCERCDGRGYVYKRYIPLIVENVRGARPWVGKSAWSFGSFHLWGDIPEVGAYSDPRRNGGKGVHLTSSRENLDGLKLGGSWFHGYRKGQGPRNYGSGSTARKAASAQIAKIPFPLANWIARCYKPAAVEGVA